MKYKDLKCHLESLEKLDEEIVTVDRYFLMGIIKEALIYRKQIAIVSRTRLTNSKTDKTPKTSK